MQYDINRFKQAQESAFSGYATALGEIVGGRKASHWIWYVFPQLKGLGRSYNANYYGLDGLEEAKAYYADAQLRRRLEEIAKALLAHKGKSIREIMGGIESHKLRSCMTLFDLVAPNAIFSEVLDAFFDSKRDRRTISMCRGDE